MARRRWSHLSERSRRLIVIAGVFETALKVAAIRDLRRRTAEGIRGSKKAWTVAIAVVNAAGAVPLAYFVLGRRKPDTT